MARDRIWLSPPHMGGSELSFVKQAFESNWVAPVGPHIRSFESALANYVGVDHCAALSSGTAAIQLALIVLGVKSGDEVVCSSFTFAGSCNPVVYIGARPVFVDSEPDTWNMDPVLLELSIKERIRLSGKTPKAIIVVHLYGMPAKMDEIMAIATRYKIPVIEDAAEALGSTYKGRKLGSIGQVGIFSFNGNKIITTSGGGAFVSNNKSLVDEARFLATQARDPAPYYQHSVIGYNYRLSNISAGIGLGQLEVIKERVAQRRRNFSYYKKHLGDLPGIAFLDEPVGFVSNRWLTTIQLESTGNEQSNEYLRLALEKENIESRPLWKPMHLQPVFSGAAYYGDGVAEKLFKTGLCLPSGSSLTEPQLSEIVDKISSNLVTKNRVS